MKTNSLSHTARCALFELQCGAPMDESQMTTALGISRPASSKFALDELSAAGLASCSGGYWAATIAGKAITYAELELEQR